MTATACIVRRAIGRALHLRHVAGDITDEKTLRDQLAADSLDMISIAASIEDDLDVSIDDDEMCAVETVADLIALAERKVDRR